MREYSDCCKKRSCAVWDWKSGSDLRSEVWNQCNFSENKSRKNFRVTIDWLRTIPTAVLWWDQGIVYFCLLKKVKIAKKLPKALRYKGPLRRRTRCQRENNTIVRSQQQQQKKVSENWFIPKKWEKNGEDPTNKERLFLIRNTLSQLHQEQKSH